MDVNLHSDDIRDALEGDLSEFENLSEHDSDIDSNIGEEYEQEVVFELRSELDNVDIDSENENDDNDLLYEDNGFENQDNNELTYVDNGENITDEVRSSDADGEGENGVQEQTTENNGEGHGVCENDSTWKEWVDGDESFCEFSYGNDSGYKPPLGNNPDSPLGYFQLFFTDELLSEIVTETNRYANEKIRKCTPLRKRSMWWSWKDVTLPELKAFLGVIINMGMNTKPEIDDYFSTDWVDYQPFFKEVFSKERFQQLFWNLHVSPPPTGPRLGTLTRCGKVRNVVLYLDNKFRQYYIPEKNVSVDESTIGFKGKILFKIYNKDKPIKWGIKIFVLSESTSGYICALEPYFGKYTTDRMERQDLGVTSRVVLHLVNKLKDTYGSVEGLHVYTDRFYTNLDLAEALYDMKVHITGTIMRQRKGLPEQVRPKRNKKSKKKGTKGKKGKKENRRKKLQN